MWEYFVLVGVVLAVAVGWYYYRKYKEGRFETSYMMRKLKKIKDACL